MASKKLFAWETCRKSLKRLLQLYPKIEDIIIFGSTVKGKFRPEDLDLAIIVQNKDISLIGEIKEQLSFKKIDLELVFPQEMYQSRFGLTLITEGYSIKNNKFLRELLGISPMKIYLYQIKPLSQVKKVTFGRGLNRFLKKTHSVRLGSGAMMIPTKQSSAFEEFLDLWDLKYSTKEYNVF